MSINNIIMIILVSLSLVYPREKDIVIEITSQIEELLNNKEWNKVPCAIGTFVLYNSDKKLSMLSPIGRKNGKPVSTLSAVLEFLKTAEECNKIDTICYDTYIKTHSKMQDKDTTLFVEIQMQIQYNKKLLYRTWIGTGKAFKKTVFSKRIGEKIDIILLTRRARYQDLIIKLLKKDSVKNDNSISKLKEKHKQPELKEAAVYALSQDEYKKLKLEYDINETIKDRRICESRIIKELKYSEQYKLPRDDKELSKLKQSIINLDIILEGKLLKYKSKIGSDFDTSVINIDYEKRLKELKRKLIKEYLTRDSIKKEEPKIESKDIEEDIGWE